MKKEGILCVANWDSDVGYAWWLMESFWVKIAEQFAGEYDVYLAYPSISKIPEQISRSSLIVKELDFSEKPSVAQMVGQIKFLKKYNIKHVYYTDRSLSRLNYALYRIFGVKTIIVHDHTPGLRTIPKGMKRIAKAARSRLPFVNCDAVIGATDFVQKRCIDVNRFPKEKCFSANNGIKINVGAYKKVGLKRVYGIDEDAVIVVSTGRVNLYKGIDFAIDVISDLVEKGQNIHYIYFGDGPDLEACLSLVKKREIDRYVTFAGRVQGVHDYLVECDIAFHPSRGEVGYSLSILEYMRASLPVVVSDNESVRQAVIDGVNGCIYREGDIDSAVNRIAKLVGSKELRRKYGVQGRSVLKESYDINSCHKKLIDILSGVFNQ